MILRVEEHLLERRRSRKRRRNLAKTAYLLRYTRHGGQEARRRGLDSKMGCDMAAGRGGTGSNSPDGNCVTRYARSHPPDFRTRRFSSLSNTAKDFWFN